MRRVRMPTDEGPLAVFRPNTRGRGNVVSLAGPEESHEDSAINAMMAFTKLSRPCAFLALDTYLANSHAQ